MHLKQLQKITSASLLALSTFSSICASAYAGTASGQLTCRTVEQKSIIRSIQGVVPGSEENLELKVQYSGKTGIFDAGNTNFHQIEAFHHRVYTLYMTRRLNSDFIEIYALPETLKSSRTPNSLQASFMAIARSSLADVNGGELATTKMRCRYSYSV